MDIIKKEAVEHILRSHMSQKLRRYIKFQGIGNADEDSFKALCRLVAQGLNEDLKKRKVLVQTFEEELEVVFNIKGRPNIWKEENRQVLEHLFKGMQGTEDVECKILNLATYTDLGNKKSEYYDIQFPSGHILYAVSGFHLELNEHI